MEKAKNRANSMEGSLKEAQERSQLSEEDLIQVMPGCSWGVKGSAWQAFGCG